MDGVGNWRLFRIAIATGLALSLLAGCGGEKQRAEQTSSGGSDATARLGPRPDQEPTGEDPASADRAREVVVDDPGQAPVTASPGDSFPEIDRRPPAKSRAFEDLLREPQADASHQAATFSPFDPLPETAAEPQRDGTDFAPFNPLNEPLRTSERRSNSMIRSFADRPSPSQPANRLRPSAAEALPFMQPEAAVQEPPVGAAPEEMPMTANVEEDPATAAAEDGPSPAGSEPRTASTTSPVKKAAAESSDYSVVKVFYGTDRAALAEGQPANAVTHQLGLWSPLALAAAGVILAMGAFFSRRRKPLVALSVSCFMVASTVAFLHMRPLISKSSAPEMVRYGGQRGQMQYGTCEVTIPKTHQVGELEAPSILRLEVREKADKHVILRAVNPHSRDDFLVDLQDHVQTSGSGDVMVFVHGYNVSFENAARRTAQMAHDLKFQGAPIFFSWPSQQGLLKYTVDETNISWAVRHLKQFLVDIAQQSGARAINLIAHSMGNRGLTQALRELSYEFRDQPLRFNQVILAAPDIDAEVFKRDLAPSIVQSANRVTLYASSNDQALLASKKVHGYPRAGESGSGLVVVPGIETIDVSSIDTSLLGHSYYGTSDSILSDMYYLLREARPAHQRTWLRPRLREGLTYWIFSGWDTARDPSSANRF